ncbi:MAG: hypothetical protein RR710_00430 [Oscillospiraceae bacterium]
MNMQNISNNFNKSELNAKSFIDKDKFQNISNEDRKELAEQLKAQKVKADKLFLSTNYKGNNISVKTTNKTDDLSKAEDDFYRKTNAFQSLLSSMFENQDNMFEMANGSFSKLNFTNDDAIKAANSISAYGDLSADKVASKILDVAKTLAGDDKEKMATLKAAVEKGFDRAGIVCMKNNLPSICNDTYKEIQIRFDKWQDEMNASFIEKASK